MQLNAIKLKIKIKHLAEESRINRREASKLSGPEKHSLNHHRKTTIRDEARSTQLAYACIRGIPYKSIERVVKDQGKFDYFIKPRIKSMVKKYGDSDTQQLDDWLAGKEHEHAGLHTLRDAQPNTSDQGSTEGERRQEGDGHLQESARNVCVVRAQ